MIKEQPMTTKERFLGYTDSYKLLVYLTDKRLEIRSDMGKTAFSLRLKSHTRKLDKAVYMTLANGWEHGFYTAQNSFASLFAIKTDGDTLQ